MMPAAPYRAPASLPSRALMSGMPMKALLGMTAALHQHGLLAAGQVHGPAQHKADADGEDVEDLQHHIAFEHAGHGLAAAVDAGTGQQGAGQGDRHDQVGQELAVPVIHDAQFGHGCTGADLQKDDQDLLQKNRDRHGSSLYRQHHTGTGRGAPVVVNGDLAVDDAPVRPVAFWAGFVKVA